MFSSEYGPDRPCRVQVDNFQPFYVWHKRHLNDLKTGAAIIKEALERENVKEVQAQRRKEEEKAAQEAAKAKVFGRDYTIVSY